MNQNLINYDATGLIELLRSKQITPSDIADSFLKVIREKDDTLNAWEYVNIEAINNQLKKINQIDPNKCLLWGIPIGIKDIYNTFDMPTQMGSPLWAGFTPGNDARIVHYLRRQGSIILGKTTTAEFAVHYQTKTLNPHDLTRSPGTSSSGSAVSVASNMVPIAFGSQTAGSISRPASYCGVYGYKPTFGTLPRIGVLKTTDTLDSLGIFTKSGRDLKLVFDASRVHGKNYEYVYKYLDNYTPTSNKKFKVAIIEHSKWDLVSDFSKKQFSELIKEIPNDFCEINNFNWPQKLNKVHDIHSLIYDKTIAYYFKKEYEQHTLISPIFNEIIKSGNKISTQEYKDAVAIQAKMTLEAYDDFSEYDILLTLSTADEAPIGLTTPDIPDSNLIWTFLGMPTVSLPLLKGENGLPIGVLAIAKKYDDYRLLEFVELIEKVFTKNIYS